jgi:Ca2+-binding EF-hand superfamily protein
MTSTPSNTPTGRSLDRQITTKDIDCLREAFALFDNDRKEEITTVELGKVMHKILKEHSVVNFHLLYLKI